MIIQREVPSKIIFIIFGLALGVDKFYSNYLPIDFLHGIPLIVIISLLLGPCYVSDLKLTSVPHRIIVLLIGYGVIVAVIRYFLYYSTNSTFMPIIRQSIALLMGLFLLISFQNLLKKINYFTIGKLIVITSTPFLVLGFYQFLTGHQVNNYQRIVSLFSEPAYYGDYLVLLIAPCFLFLLIEKDKIPRTHRFFYIALALIWLINLYATQSGTAVLKISTFVTLIFCFFPIQLKHRIKMLIFFAILTSASLYLESGYITKIIRKGTEVLSNPNTFFEYHTFYDRLYPLYAVFKKMFMWDGLLGLGFGGDYFEFKNLFPPSTHAEMIFQKPTLSFFNSFASKIVLYFGLSGLLWLGSLFTKAIKASIPIVKIGLLNVLVASLWGVSNFSLPYIWFWLAFALNEQEVVSKKS